MYKRQNTDDPWESETDGDTSDLEDTDTQVDNEVDEDSEDSEPLVENTHHAPEDAAGDDASGRRVDEPEPAAEENEPTATATADADLGDPSAPDAPAISAEQTTAESDDTASVSLFSSAPEAATATQATGLTRIVSTLSLIHI